MHSRVPGEGDPREDGYARVVPDYASCADLRPGLPAQRQQVRDDLPDAKALLTSGRKAIASLAPSFVAQYSGVRPAQLIHALKKLGFFAVSETALGAQQVSATVFSLMHKKPKQIWISSACPVVVDFIAKYHPECQPHVFGVLSPLLTHCKMLRAYYGGDIAIVFIGPCIAKKKEAEQHPELLDAVLTFEDLDRWLTEENIHLAEIAETRRRPLSAGRGPRRARSIPSTAEWFLRLPVTARSTVSAVYVVLRDCECRTGAEEHSRVEAGTQHLF